MDTTPHPTDSGRGQLQETKYDVVALGGGPTGENVADYATRGGLRILAGSPSSSASLLALGVHVQQGAVASG